MKSHKDLDAWKAAIAVAKETYLVTRSFPKEEQFGMTTQMRRASVSIASNIAEGAARQGDKDFPRFLRIALGSAAELETQLVISKEIGLGLASDLERLDEAITHVRKLLIGLIRAISPE
jgi:four helix bundle protein